ncbi:MAG: hypothetical protein M1828_000262 [Chrysothrix sp. TS-e1954]|nr:MAG: hypothetical protein M1828_000262 [Chrysothrix sp. TS-e1954]
MVSLAALVACLASVSLSSAHLVLTYPGWRGDNLHKNGTPNVDDYTTGFFPYGMQWQYPCGGLKVTDNRTHWPIGGGAVALEPGWFAGHKQGLININLGHGNQPENYSHPMVKAFGIVGPTDESYPGIPICQPQVSTPKDLPPFNEGDNATIQVILTAQHGATLYSCVDITFTNDMSKVANVNSSNCYNDSRIGITTIFTTESLAQTTSDALKTLRTPKAIGALSTLVALGAVWMSLA